MESRPTSNIARLSNFTITHSETASQIYQAHEDKLQISVCLHFLEEKQLVKQKKKYERLASCGFHPHKLHYLYEARSRFKSAIVLQDFEQNAINFVANRLKLAKPLTAMELVFVMRQVIVSLADLEQKRIPHGCVHIKNIAISRNSQKQLIFKLGYLDAEEDIPANANHASDIFNIAIIICQMMLLDSNDIVRGEELDATEHAFRTKQQQLHAGGLSIDKEKALQAEVKKLSKQVKKLRLKMRKLRIKLQKKVDENYPNLPKDCFQILLQMLDGNPAKRPSAVYALEQRLARFDIIDLAQTLQSDEQKLTPFAAVMKPSVKSEPIFPAGSFTEILKIANNGDAEAQYQIALLMAKAGSDSQILDWATQAAEQGHADAQWFAANVFLTGIGIAHPDITKAEEFLRKAAAQQHTDAQIALAKLILTKRELKQEEYNEAMHLLSLAAATNADAKDAMVLLSCASLFDSANEAKAPIDALNDIYHRKTKQIDQAKSRLDAQSVLMGTVACFVEKPRITQPFELKFIDPAKPSIRILRTKTQEEQVEVKKLSDAKSLNDQSQKYFLLCQIPKHPNLQRIGFCGYFEPGDTRAPDSIATVVPIMSQGSLNDFFAKKENQQKPVPLLSWAVQMASALEALHARNLIHDDLSLNNFFINVINGIPNVVLDDCVNHVRFAQDNPEEKEFPKGENIADFGWTLLELLIKSDPLKRDTIKFNKTMEAEKLTQLFELILQPPISASQELCDLIKRCLNRFVVERPTARELVDSLSKITKIEPTRIRENTPVFVDDVCKLGETIYADSPKFASELLRYAASTGHAAAQRKLAELLWFGDVLPENKEEAFRYCTLAVKNDPANRDDLRWLLDEYEKQREQRQQSELKKQQEDKEHETSASSSAASLKPKEDMCKAFELYFGRGVPRDLKQARTHLVDAAEGKSSANAELARAILATSGESLDAKSTLRFYVPGDDFKAPFMELDPTVYRRPGRAFRCSVHGRPAVLLEVTDPRTELNRCTLAHPNVIGAIAITADVTGLTSKDTDRLSCALLYAPAQAMLANRKLVSNPTTACSRLLPFLCGVAEGLSHLHRSNFVHGNVSLPFLAVGYDELGIIITCPVSSIRASAPESLSSHHFSTASDVFDFAKMCLYMVTGDEQMQQNAGEIDPDTQLGHIIRHDASSYADIRRRIPQWCPTQLVDFMMRCLHLDPTQRPTMEAVAVKMKDIRSSLQHSLASAMPQPTLPWINKKNIFPAIKMDKRLLQVFECLYDNQDQLNCSQIELDKQKRLADKFYDPENYPDPITKKISEHKAQFFLPKKLFSEDGIEEPDYGDRHRPGNTHGPQLLDDKRLAALFANIDNPPYKTVMCDGKSGTCQCHRDSRPKNPGILKRIPEHLLREFFSYLEPSDYGAVWDVCKRTNRICAGNTAYLENVIVKHANQGQNYFTLDIYKKAGNFEAMISRWAKIIMTQLTYKRAYTQLKASTVKALIHPVMSRDERLFQLPKLQNEFKAIQGTCGICRKPTSYAAFHSDESTREAGGIFMAESNCLAHQVWTVAEAQVIWGFTPAQLKNIPFWLDGDLAMKFMTADLYDFRIREPMIVDEDTEAREASDDIWKRYHDLPRYDKEFSIVEHKAESTVNESKDSAKDSSKEKNSNPKYRVVFFKSGKKLPEENESHLALANSENDTSKQVKLKQ